MMGKSLSHIHTQLPKSVSFIDHIVEQFILQYNNFTRTINVKIYIRKNCEPFSIVLPKRQNYIKLYAFEDHNSFDRKSNQLENPSFVGGEPPIK